MHRSLVTAIVLLLVPVAAASQVPDPEPSTVPAFIYVVGRVGQGARPDPVGLATVTLRDFANNPIVGAIVTIDFSGCCDIALCDAVVNGVPVPVTGNRFSGQTNQSGQMSFTALGAARDPGDREPPDQYGGCGRDGVRVFANTGGGDVALRNTTAVTLDLNGAAGNSNGTTISDVANVLRLFGSIGLGSPYRGRGDINADGQVTFSDVGALLSHSGRLALAGGVGCTAPHVAGPGCP